MEHTKLVKELKLIKRRVDTLLERLRCTDDRLIQYRCLVDDIALFVIDHVVSDRDGVIHSIDVMGKHREVTSSSISVQQFTTVFGKALTLLSSEYPHYRSMRVWNGKKHRYDRVYKGIALTK